MDRGAWQVKSTELQSQTQQSTQQSHSVVKSKWGKGLIYQREIDSQTQKTNLWLWKEKWGIKQELGINIYATTINIYVVGIQQGPTV